jgi:hypothetical protein
MDSLPVNNKTAGEPESTYNNTLEAGAAMTQVSPSALSDNNSIDSTRISLQSRGYVRISTRSMHMPMTQSGMQSKQTTTVLT